jgi:hypothetical protein
LRLDQLGLRIDCTLSYQHEEERQAVVTQEPREVHVLDCALIVGKLTPLIKLAAFFLRARRAMVNQPQFPSAVFSIPGRIVNPFNPTVFGAIDWLATSVANPSICGHFPLSLRD